MTARNNKTCRHFNRTRLHLVRLLWLWRSCSVVGISLPDIFAGFSASPFQLCRVYHPTDEICVTCLKRNLEDGFRSICCHVLSDRRRKWGGGTPLSFPSFSHPVSSHPPYFPSLFLPSPLQVCPHKVIHFGTNRFLIYDFLYAVNSNLL